jgi:class 3 adenylate cyclase
MRVRKTQLLKTVPCRGAIFFSHLAIIAAIVVILIFLLPLGLPYVKDARSFPYIEKALVWEKSLSSIVQGVVPTRISGMNITRWIGIGCAVVLGILSSRIRSSCRMKLSNIRIRDEYEEWKVRMKLSDDAKVIMPLKEKFERLGTAPKGERDELLKLFADTKKKLDTMGKELAFLSIGIVDSTGLKEGEESASIEYDFKEYKKFVENKLRMQGALKFAWTPEGVMSCFRTVEAAVRAAREVIDGLEAFNTHVKTMRKDFRVRCGINAGLVYFDDQVPMEEMTDRVIDVAGHMQKHAAPNTICLAKNLIKPILDPTGFVPISKIIDGYEVYVWNKEG